MAVCRNFFKKGQIWGTVKPALVTTCIQRPPLFKDHLVMSQLWLFLPLLRDHLYSKTTFFWPKRGRLIQVSLYGQKRGGGGGGGSLCGMLHPTFCPSPPLNTALRHCMDTIYSFLTVLLKQATYMLYILRVSS